MNETTLRALESRLAAWRELFEPQLDPPAADGSDSILLEDLRLETIDDPRFAEQRENIRSLVHQTGKSSTP